jgi:hypothetical protein
MKVQHAWQRVNAPPASSLDLELVCGSTRSSGCRQTRWMRRVRKTAEPSRMCVGAWNVGSLTSKLREVVDTMIRRCANILYIQETKWKGHKAKGVEDTSFKLCYTGNTSSKNDVGIMLDKRLKDGVVGIKRQGDRIILVKLLIEDLVFNVINAYAPQIGLNESAKMHFKEELDALVSSMLISKKLFIGGDLNGYVGSTRVSFDGVHGGFGYGSSNQEGEGILNIALAYDLIIANTLFRKSLLSSKF